MSPFFSCVNIQNSNKFKFIFTDLWGKKIFAFIQKPKITHELDNHSKGYDSQWERSTDRRNNMRGIFFPHTLFESSQHGFSVSICEAIRTFQQKPSHCYSSRNVFCLESFLVVYKILRGWPPRTFSLGMTVLLKPRIKSRPNRL